MKPFKESFTRIAFFTITLVIFIHFGCLSAIGEQVASGGNGRVTSDRCLPDTGQRLCFDNAKEIPCPKPGMPFYGQDGNYLLNPQSYSVIQEGSYKVVLDKVTGLKWRRVGGSAKNIVEAVETIEGFGKGNWRLPQILELESLASYGQGPGFIFEVFNAAGDVTDCYWSFTTRGFPAIDFLAFCSSSKEIVSYDQDERLEVLAVSGPPLEFGRYVDSGNGTVVDTTTGLMFQVSETRPMTWEEALRYCEDLSLGGYSDWRLPNVRELLSIVKFKEQGPCIDEKWFPGARPGIYWSSTTFERAPNMSWVVDFSKGVSYPGGFKRRRYFVRAVRGGHQNCH